MRPDELRRQAEEELEHHISLRVEALVRRGVDPDEARHRVLAEAGDLDRARRTMARGDAARQRHERRRDLLAGWMGEVRWGVRSALRRPGSAALAVGVLAATLALNIVVFTLVEGVLLAPLPIPDAARVVVLQERPADPSRPPVGVSYPTLDRWRRGSAGLEAVAAHLTASATLSVGGEVAAIEGARVTSDFLDMVGLTIVTGRGLEERDHRVDSEPAVVISSGLWARAFGSDPAVVGSAVDLDAGRHRVVGVAAGTPWPDRAEFWAPIEASAPGLVGVWGARIFQVLGRARPGVEMESLTGELATLAAEAPDGGEWTVALTPVAEHLLGDVRRPLALLQAAVALVLLIACANVGLVLLARSLRRRGEMAVRKALGGSPGRLVAAGLAESLALAVLAGALGLALAVPGLELALRLVPVDVPRTSSLGVHPGVALFALGLTCLTGLAAGLLPALHGARAPVMRALAESSSARSGSRWADRTRSALVVGQVALSVTLLATAGVLLRSFLVVVGQDTGMEPAGVTTFQLELPAARYPDGASRLAYIEGALERVRSAPGVEAAAVARNVPATGSSMVSPVMVGDARTPEPAQIAWVSSDYFRVVGMLVRQGRAFDEGDRADERPVAVVDETFVGRFLADRAPLGERTHSFFGPAEPREVVGIVGGVRHGGLMAEPVPVFYQPFFQDPVEGAFWLLVRSRGPTASLAAGVRDALRQVDPEVPVRSVATLRDLLGRTAARPRFYAVVLSLFAGLSLALTVVGTYSLVSHGVTERHREIGIRMALGAQAGAVRGMVVRRSLALAVLGLVPGLAGALVATAAVEGMLFHVRPTDPVVLLSLPLLVALAALAAAWIPARRATSVDPIGALRDG
jgi:predicted permease